MAADCAYRAALKLPSANKVPPVSASSPANVVAPVCMTLVLVLKVPETSKRPVPVMVVSTSAKSPPCSRRVASASMFSMPVAPAAPPLPRRSAPPCTSSVPRLLNVISNVLVLLPRLM